MDVRRRKEESNAQEHLFAFWDELSDPKKRKLLSQLESIDFDELRELFEKHAQQQMPSFSPPTISSRKDIAHDVVKLGIRALVQGKVAVLIVAGGDGSRLGFDGPKGAFPATAVKKKSLFQVFSERLLHVGARYGRQPPLFIMTSENNHDQTRSFFKENDNFGIDEPVCFKQRMLPVVDHEGRVLLSDKDQVLFAPCGHGGTYEALHRSGVLEKMKSEGIEYLYYLQVDNPLALIADPLFIGAHIDVGAEMSTKVVEKAYPEEKVGLIVEADGKTRMCEYPHLSEEQAYARDDDGRLSFRAANIAVHVINRDFIERIVADHSLPFYLANKKVECIDEHGDHVTPLEPNAYKFESFVFDALPMAESSLTLEVDREEEFAPIKNATGKDSPASAREQMTRLYKKWLRSAGIPDKLLDEVAEVEISPLLAVDKDEFVAKIRPSLEQVIAALKKKKNLYLS